MKSSVRFTVFFVWLDGNSCHSGIQTSANLSFFIKNIYISSLKTSMVIRPLSIGRFFFFSVWNGRNAKILWLCSKEHGFPKGLAKLGNIVVETLLQTQMFPRLATQETYVAEGNFASWKQGNVSESSQKHFCFTYANFASKT